MKRLDGKSVLITGASTGIGEAMAIRFAHEGAEVIVGDINIEAGTQVANSMVNKGYKAKFINLDVSNEASVQQAIVQIKNSYKSLDVVVNNAGGSTLNDKSVTDIDLDEFWRAIKVDLFGVVLICRYAIPELIKAGGGSIINMGSIAAHRGLKGRDAYTAAKGGVTSLSRAIAVQYAEQKVRCNVIAPGAVLSDRMKHFIKNDPRVAAAVEKHLLGLPEPSEIADMALFLASDESRHVTGSVFHIDGGRSAAT